MASHAVDPRRVREIRPFSGSRSAPVVYWMSRDQRVDDNWALLHARELAAGCRAPLVVLFVLVPSFLGAARRQYAFMLDGLRETAERLNAIDIGFLCVAGEPGKAVPEWVDALGAQLLVTDFDPLRVKQAWNRAVLDRSTVAVHTVDAHNIVPCWETSDKQEYAARTIRPKLHRKLPEFLRDFPSLRRHPVAPPGELPEPDWSALEASLDIDESVAAVDWLTPGSRSAAKALRRFVEHRLEHYDDERNDPCLNGQSDLSPYLHFGQLSAQRVALVVSESQAARQHKEAFLEELIVRRELSDNFCFYNRDYDKVGGFPDWARKTLKQHRADRRDTTYDRATLERADTHDEIWNAAQQEMVKRGKMHGYMRMYWAKKILEWAETPEEALAAVIELNDRYELDGRDPNGYVGAAWSIGGVHDRPWQERPIFGKIRYMSDSGCRRKFDVDEYVHSVRAM